MKTFQYAKDLGSLKQALAEAQEIKNDRFKCLGVIENVKLFIESA